MTDPLAIGQVMARSGLFPDITRVSRAVITVPAGRELGGWLAQCVAIDRAAERPRALRRWPPRDRVRGRRPWRRPPDERGSVASPRRDLRATRARRSAGS